MPTASAVVADMIDTAVGRTRITFRTLELWSNRKARVDRNDYAAARGRFYLRTTVEDHPGVLSQVTAALGRQRVSIASVLQHEPLTGDDVVPLVIMTHNTDIADGWEREGEDDEFFYSFSPDAYALGINIILYALSH